MSIPGPNILAAAIKEDVRYAKGRFLDSGASGILEILPCGDLIKSPWPGKSGKDSRRDITTEYAIYRKLGRHARLIRIFDWDLQDCALTMEYMPNGNLQAFLLVKNDTVAEIQRLRWVQEAAEGNFLLDEHLGLKIADFGGSSLAGSRPSACSGQRFSLPGKCWRDPPTVQDDLFALGTTIYFIMTCGRNYRNHRFPDISQIVCGEFIKRCWSSQITSAQEIYDFIRSIV
ncbi:kinase-like domain-containing protein [Rhexocercosporidium sp. MPI-PUGE-AT-0058]|nr:kinase-like domain-containing protein [Rhexocercosporidium sp. MPI-PUGE-AT-0058]